MSTMARALLLTLAALLSACANRPAPVAVPAKPVVFINPADETSPIAADVLFRALGLVGTPYRWGGNTPDSGFDGSGLIKNV